MISSSKDELSLQCLRMVNNCYGSLTKTELIELGRSTFKSFKYLLDPIIEESTKNVKLLWTPVAHCELNAIELIWANVKSWVAKNNKTYKVNDH